MPLTPFRHRIRKAIVGGHVACVSGRGSRPSRSGRTSIAAPREAGDELPLSMTDVRTFCALYLGDSGEGDGPVASPLLAADLTGLPQAYIAGAEYDVLRGDGEWYPQRLGDVSVPVELHLGEGRVHMSRP
ncbi:alpha/beta hydrolase [Streptomyces canus]|nr:alpha/beta hydrolase [Streptomyces canus]